MEGEQEVSEKKISKNLLDPPLQGGGWGAGGLGTIYKCEKNLHVHIHVPFLYLMKIKENLDMKWVNAAPKFINESRIAVNHRIK